MLKYKNGSCSRLPTTPGFYISAAGCGSGKSYNIIQLAKTHSKEGVLIITPTIESAEELAGSIPGSFCLHSMNLSNIQAYQNDPKMLITKDVLIVTSARVIIDPVELFLGYMLGNRGWVFIDELISFYPEPYQVPQKIRDALTYINTSKLRSVGKVLVDGKRYYQHIYKTRPEMKAALKMSKKNVFREDGLGEYKTDKVLEHIRVNGFSPIQQNIIKEAVTRKAVVILFDATSDVVFPGDKRILPLSGYKYSSDIQFIQFDMPIKRKNNASSFDVSELERYAAGFVKLVKDITAKEKLLIVTWKTIDIFKNNGDADSFEGQIKVSSNFPVILKDMLLKNGATPGNLEVIYRGSGQDRGTNEFQNFESVMFLGEWRVPDNITKDIAAMFESKKVLFEDYMMALVIQTICRLRIRQHKRLPIKVYFSEDCSYERFYRVQEYFISTSDPGCKISGLTPPGKRYSKPQKGFVLDMVALYQLDTNLQAAIENNQPYSFSLTFDDIFSTIPRDRKKQDRYKPLINYLRKRNITLTITTV